MTSSCLGEGSLRTVWQVVTTGMRTRRTKSRMDSPHSPPKMPYSCCRQQTSTLDMLRKSAASRYSSRRLSLISNQTRGG